MMAGVSSQNERVYAGLTPAQRQAVRRQALFDAALDEIASAGWRQLRVETICGRAHVNRKYFYELFDDIDDFAGAVVDQLAQDAIAACSKVPTEIPVPEFAHAALEAFVCHLTDDPRRAEVLFGENISTAAVDAHRAAALRRIASDVTTHARQTHPDSSDDDPIAELTSSVLVGGTARAILDWLAGKIPMGRDQLISDLAALWLITGEGAVAYSAHRAAAPGGGTAV
jgi:AcrR family transcriptional regulator